MLEDLAIRNQILLERIKRNESDKLDPYIRRIELFIQNRLTESGDLIGSRAELNEILGDIKGFQLEQYSAFTYELLLVVEELANDQADFEYKALSDAIANTEVNTAKAVIPAIYNNPMSIPGLTSSPLIRPFIKGWEDSQIQAVETRIRQGYSQAETVPQIVRGIRGTKRLQYKDGIMSTSRRHLATMTHTVIQHASSQARKKTWEANDDVLKGYEWVSTLDKRTSRVCQSLDGRIFKIGKGPMPPAHPNCRSTTIPAVDSRYDLFASGSDRPSVGSRGAKKVDGNTTYYEWLKGQPRSFQEIAIGKTRTQLLRDGGLSAKEFAALQLDKNFQPLTLDEMRALRPKVFENAGIL